MGPESPDDEPCPYCERVAGRYEWQRPPAVIHENELICVFVASRPMGGMAGHTLVTTKRHAATVCDLERSEEAAIGRAVASAARMLRAAVDLDGVLVTNGNAVEAFVQVPHVHFHVIPKRAGAPWPAIDDPGRVSVEDREALVEALRPHWVGERGDD